MHGTLFALAMIGMVCTTIAILKLYGRRPDRNGVVSGLLLSVITAAVLSYIAFGHLCDRGGPWGTVVVGSVLAGTLLRDRRKERYSSLVMGRVVRGDVLGHGPLPSRRLHREPLVWKAPFPEGAGSFAVLPGYAAQSIRGQERIGLAGRVDRRVVADQHQGRFSGPFHMSSWNARPLLVHMVYWSVLFGNAS